MTLLRVKTLASLLSMTLPTGNKCGLSNSFEGEKKPEAHLKTL